MLLVLLHDFPEFLCDYHYNFCDVIPPNCIQVSPPDDCQLLACVNFIFFVCVMFVFLCVNVIVSNHH